MAMNAEHTVVVHMSLTKILALSGFVIKFNIAFFHFLLFVSTVLVYSSTPEWSKNIPNN